MEFPAVTPTPRFFASCGILVFLWCPGSAQHLTTDRGALFDMVVTNGRVIDPERRIDSLLNIGIRAGSVAALTAEPITGKVAIDARGRVVAPGFIDILSYNPGQTGVWNKIADGVTTNLAMHGGTSNPKAWYAQFTRERPPLNFGASFFYTEARNQFAGNRYRPAPAGAIAKIVGLAERALQGGALGISFSLEYIPGISAEEIRPMMALAKKFGVPVFFHVRYSDMEEPGTNIDALNEVIGYAGEFSVPVHIDHIHSTGGTFSMQQSLAMIQDARDAGMDITACVYPYTFWGTYLNSARFDRGWQQRFRISYGDLQLGGSPERLTEESFKKYQRLGKLAIAYAIPESDVEDALRAPFVMIGSDAILTPGFNNHPRASGTFCRTLRVYVREKNTISLMDAVAKMSYLPARRLETSSDAMKNKGRIAVGADADLVIFDPHTVSDRSTVERPEIASGGIDYVIVGGLVVKDPTGIKKRVRPGKGIYNRHKAPE